MDLNENIRIASEQVFKASTTLHEAQAFREGALSQQAKEYWFAEFKQQEATQSVGAFVEHFGPSPIKSMFHEGLFDELMSDEPKVRRIGIVGHGPGVAICGDRFDKTSRLPEMIAEAKERGIVIVGVDDLPEVLKGLSQVHEFTRRPEIVMPIQNFQDEDFKLTSCTSEYFPPQESKPWDRKTLPNKMNNYKSKKRNKR